LPKPKFRQLLPQGVLRASKPEEVNGVFKMAVYTKDNVQWPDGPSIDKLIEQLMLRAEGVEFIEELTLAFRNRHIWLRVQFVADITSQEEANQLAFGIEQILKDPFQIDVGEFEELKKRRKNRVPGRGRTQRIKRSSKPATQPA
jgi:hypothetical protein